LNATKNIRFIYYILNKFQQQQQQQ
jgi:hypothetical protein